MRIALFSEIYLYEINGVVTHVRSLAQGLRDRGHEVLVVTADIKTNHHYLKDGVLHCPAIVMKKIYGYGAALPISPPCLIYIRKFQPDVIHIHTEMAIGLSGLAAAKLLRIPVVYTLHTMYDDYMHYLSRRFRRQATFLSHKYLRMFANRSTALIGPSSKCEEYFRAIGVRKPVSIVRNPVERLFTPEFADAEEEKVFRENLGIAPDVMFVCFVGRIGQEKNLDGLLRYWSEVIRPEDAIHLLVIGDGPAREELTALAGELRVSDMVSFLGSLPHEALPFYYRVCKAYVTASLSEVYSISMLEAMASGLAVLQLKDDLNSEQIQEGVNGYIYENAEQLGERLRALRDMTEETYARFRIAVAQSIGDNSQDNVTESVLTIYRAITDRKHESGRMRQRRRRL